MMMNEKIKASEVLLKGLNGEDLGIVSTKEALQMAKEHKVDLVCLSLASSPPPCQLVGRADFKQQTEKQKRAERKAEKGLKTKEIRLSEHIEDHDYDTKKRQAERILNSGDAVQVKILLEGKKNDSAKELAKKFVSDLKLCGKQEKGIQSSGKQIMVEIHPL